MGWVVVVEIGVVQPEKEAEDEAVKGSVIDKDDGGCFAIDPARPFSSWRGDDACSGVLRDGVWRALVCRGLLLDVSLEGVVVPFPCRDGETSCASSHFTVGR